MAGYIGASIPAVSSGSEQRFSFLASSGQTVFSVVYKPGFEHVFQNGVRLRRDIDYTANESDITLSNAATADDEIVVVVYATFQVADTYTKNETKLVVFPIGYQYTMYAVAASDDPAVAFPAAERPDALFGGTWELLWDTEGVFFRTEGTSTTADNDGRVSGLQDDQMQRITGSLTDVRGNDSQITESGALKSADSGVESYGQSSTAAVFDLSFDSADSPDARASATTDGETRPVNRLFRIYRRTA